MAIAGKRAGPIRPGSVITELYAATSKTFIKGVMISNSDDAANSFQMWLVPSGDVLDEDTRIAQRYPIAGRDIIIGFLAGYILETGDALWCQAPSNALVVFTASLQTGVP